MAQVRAERCAAEIDGDFVVFLIGMRTAKLLFLVPLTISARFYPGRIFESSSKPYAPAFVPISPV